MFGGIAPTVGVMDNVLYDIIPLVPNGIGPVEVNATTFEVDCGSLPTAQQVVNKSVTQQTSDNTISAYTPNLSTVPWVFNLDSQYNLTVGVNPNCES